MATGFTEQEQFIQIDAEENWTEHCTLADAIRDREILTSISIPKDSCQLKLVAVEE